MNLDNNYSANAINTDVIIIHMFIYNTYEFSIVICGPLHS